MKFKDIQKLPDPKFHRLTGISWSTFNLMLEELKTYLPANVGKGRPHKLPLEAPALMHRVLEGISDIVPSRYELQCF